MYACPDAASKAELESTLDQSVSFSLRPTDDKPNLAMGAHVYVETDTEGVPSRHDGRGRKQIAGEADTRKGEGWFSGDRSLHPSLPSLISLRSPVERKVLSLVLVLTRGNSRSCLPLHLLSCRERKILPLCSYHPTTTMRGRKELDTGVISIAIPLSRTPPPWALQRICLYMAFYVCLLSSRNETQPGVAGSRDCSMHGMCSNVFFCKPRVLSYALE